MGNQPHVSAADDDVQHVAGKYYTGLWNHHDLGTCEVWLANAPESVLNRLLAIPRVSGIHNDAPRSLKEIEKIKERLDIAARKDPAISYHGSSPTHDGYLQVLVERDAASAQAKLDAMSGSDVVRVREARAG